MPILAQTNLIGGQPVGYLIAMCGAALCLVLGRVLQPHYYRSLWGTVWSNRRLLSLYGDEGQGTSIGALLHDVLAVLVGALVAHHFLSGSTGWSYFQFLMGVGLVYIGRVGWLGLNALLWMDRKAAIVHVGTYLSFGRLAGILWIVPLTLALYAVQLPQSGLWKSLLPILGCLYVLYLLKVALRLYKSKVSSIAYLLLYLCAVEAAPLLWLWSWLR